MPQIENQKVVYPELSYRIIGICFGIHNKLGCYCNEQQYADALEETLKQEDVSYIRENFLPPSFKGERNRNKPDFLIDNKIIIDLKTKRAVTREDYYQMRRYLTATGMRLGVIVNFRPRFMSHKRILNSELPY